jgi:hypothetical protein
MMVSELMMGMMVHDTIRITITLDDFTLKDLFSQFLHFHGAWFC